MGLDTSHDCWHGAYSAFNRWRDKLAEVAGFEIGRSANDERPLVLIDWGRITMDNIAGEWAEMPCRPDGAPDPLILLIAHSDCDGRLPSRFCTPLADRLAEILPLLPKESGGGHIGEWSAKTQQFIDGLRRAATAGEDVDFL